MIGRTISHYKIVGQLGVGGMGIVYRAEDARLGRSVALKFLPEELATDKQAVDRLRAEARSASALNHASICAIYDVGEDEGRPYIVMELLKGQNLRDRLTAGGMKVHQIVDVGIQIADALDAAHSEGIIHRDIKPANIFLTDRYQVKLLDFGVAKLTPGFAPSGTTAHPDLTIEGVTLGTISYMSPEQAAGESLDGRSDLFSLGVVLYECATGRQPFLGKTSAVILSNILNRAPVAPVVLNPDLPVHLQELINNCLEKDRELRYQSAADLRADLKRLRRDLESGQSRAVGVATSSAAASQMKGLSASRATSPATIEPAQPSSTQLTQASSRRWPSVAAVAAVALIAAGAYAYWRRPEATAPVASAPLLSEADVQNRIDQAAAAIAARLAEEAKQKEQAVSEPPRAAPPPRSEPRRSEPAPTAVDPPAPPTVPAAVAAPPPTAPPPPPQTASPGEPPPVSAQRPVTALPAAPPPDPLPTPAPAAASPAPASPSPAPSSEPRREPTASAEEDEAAIRRVVATYARAIETKDIALFRSVKPNLSREEQRRLEEGFRAVSKQSVNLTILSIERKGPEATVTLRRRDTIQTGARQQTAESQQMLALTRAGSGWIVTEIR